MRADEREAIARIIDPAQWRMHDDYMERHAAFLRGEHEETYWERSAKFGVEMTLAKADAILSRVSTPSVVGGEEQTVSVAGLPAHVASATETDTQHSAGWQRDHNLLYILTDTGQYRRGLPVRSNRLEVSVRWDPRYATEEEGDALVERLHAALSAPPADVVGREGTSRTESTDAPACGAATVKPCKSEGAA